MLQTIQIDSREKAHAIETILSQFRQNCVKYYVSKLYVGDYADPFNARVVVDRKQNLNEVCSNLCQGHDRFRDELLRAKEAGIRIVLLVEHGPSVKCIADVEKWVNPREKKNKGATTGPRLAKAMQTMAERYDVEWRFCAKDQTGNEIIRILTEERHD
jgi:ERCC4-type nuclease